MSAPFFTSPLQQPVLDEPPIPAPSTAIILAAGRGGRLAPLTDDIPKCLLRIEGMSLIAFQINKLHDVGIDDIVIVTGYMEEKVRRECGDDCTYIHNDKFGQTNSLFSLHCARERVKGGCVVFNSDVLFHIDLLTALIDSELPDAILVDFREDLGEEEMKVKVAGSEIKRISKDIAPWNADGENVGIVKLSEQGATLLMKIAEEEFARDNTNLWVPQGIGKMIPRHPFHTIPTNDLPWIEIDYIHDLERAKTEVYPLCK